MVVPYTGINLAIASQNTEEKINVGKVADGTYNEDLAFQRATELVNTYDEKRQEKSELEQKLAAKELAYDESIKNAEFIEAYNLLVDIQAIKSQINDLQIEIDEITQEYNEIQEENMKLYYIEPALYDKYVTAKDEVENKIHKQYWEGKSFDESQAAFPLVGAGIDHKQKAVEITLYKGIENSTKKDQYIAIIDELMPKDIPWFVTYEDYAAPVACTSRTSPCSPYIGGVQIGIQNDSTCTLGIQATRSGVNGFVTAGHCANNGPSGADVSQPGSGLVVGDLVIHTFFNNSPCDCAFISDRAASPAVDNAIFQSSSSTYTPVTATSAGGQAGQQVKKSGVTTGNTLGTVTSTSISRTYDGVTITNLVRSTMTVNCGDSGAPVTNGLGSSFFGIVAAKDGANCVVSNVTYHSPYDRITSYLNANPVLG
jgi:hypothetical protein